jgi:hypothetical protein
MVIIRSAVEQLSLGHFPGESMWLIDGTHEPDRSIWIAVCTDGQVQLRTRALDALPSALGRGREDFDVQALGTAGPEVLSWLAQVLMACRFWELATASAPPVDGSRYTLKLALGAERFECATDLARLRSHDQLRSIHEAFCWVRDHVSQPDAPPQSSATNLWVKR